MTNDLYSADKVNKLEDKVKRLEKIVAKLVARETNKEQENQRRKNGK